MSFFRFFKPLDIPLAALSLGVALLSLVYATTNRGKNPVLVVTAPSGEWRFSLGKNAREHIPGLLGDSVIEIRAGEARFAESPCRNKVCVLHAPLKAGGAWSACLPNRVMLRIESGGASEIDAVTD
ncbi:MAG: NusG domain II-containing protein [Spirochaetaceae bacterium]|nr:NusG domain II-containing protein [Spirochaetaceae bacterium]